MCCAVLYSNVLYAPHPPGRTLASGHPRTLAALRPPAVTPRPTQDDPSLSICPRPGGQPRCHGATVPWQLGPLRPARALQSRSGQTRLPSPARLCTPLASSTLGPEPGNGPAAEARTARMSLHFLLIYLCFFVCSFSQLVFLFSPCQNGCVRYL